MYATPQSPHQMIPYHLSEAQKQKQVSDEILEFARAKLKEYRYRGKSILRCDASPQELKDSVLKTTITIAFKGTKDDNEDE